MQLDLTYNKEADRWELKQGQPSPPPEGQKAEMHQMQALSEWAKQEVFGLPIMGAAIAVVGSTLVDRFVMQLVPAGWGPAGNLVVAWGINQFLPQFIGKEAARLTAFVLTYEAIADTVEGWINQMFPAAAVSQAMAHQGARQSQPHTGDGIYAGVV